MMYRSVALIAALSLAVSVEGFSLGPVAFHRPSTCLFAEEGDADAATEDKTPAGDAASNDILNSPAFLQRKLDVIKSDITKAEEDIEAAKVQLEAGKAEWAQQFEGIEAEVSARSPG